MNNLWWSLIFSLQNSLFSHQKFIYEKPFMSNNHFRVDESIIPYYGRHETKQLIRCNSIRFAFKIGCLCLSDGYLIHTRLCCAIDSDIEKIRLRQEPDTVLSLAEKCKLKGNQQSPWIFLLQHHLCSIDWNKWAYMPWEQFQKADC